MKFPIFNIIDDFVALISHKLNALSYFKIYLNEVANRFNGGIKMIKIDCEYQ